MEIVTKTVPGYHQTDSTEITITDTTLKIILNIDSNGNIVIAGAPNITVDIPTEKIFSEQNSIPGDILKVNITKSGVMGGPEIMLYRSKLLEGKSQPCLSFSEENNKVLVTAKDGAGSWDKHIILSEKG